MLKSAISIVLNVDRLVVVPDRSRPETTQRPF